VIEARLAWPGAAAYRSYDVPRAGEAPHEAIDLMAIAQLDKRGDRHGVGVLELLNGERRQAASYLERAGESPDVLADRAALALSDHQPERALALADAALARRAGHPAALWNRALALRDLGLARSSAAAFREVARLGEPGWVEEARQRASTVDREVTEAQQRDERITRASAALAEGKDRSDHRAEIELRPEDARAQPGFARGVMYDAIRAATTPAQLAALQPLAGAIDGADQDTAMQDAIARAKASLHPELSRQYAEMIRALAVEMQIVPRTGAERPVPAGAERSRLVAALRAAHADDLLIGVLMKTGDDRRTVNASEIDEFARLTAASPDPWMQLLGLQQQAQLALKQEDYLRAEAILLRARQRCTPVAPAFRCVTISRLLGDLYLRWQRLPEARAVLTAAWSRARQTGEWLLQHAVLNLLPPLYQLGDDVGASGLPLVRAYVDELVLGAAPEGGHRCRTEAWGRGLIAQMLINQLRFDEARRELAGPDCEREHDAELEASELFARSEVARYGDTGERVAGLRRAIAQARKLPDASAADQVLLDHAEGRLLIDRDPAAGQALLERAIAEAGALPVSVGRAHKAASWSYSVLVVAAAHRGEGDAALRLLGREQQLTVPERCVVGLAIEDHQRAVVARDAAGKILVHFDEGRTAPAIDPTSLVPPDIAAALAGCPVVDAIARPPVHGMARLFGDAIAWRYLARRDRPIAGGAPPVAPRSLVVGDVEPPPALELPRLATWSTSTSGELLSGAAATPSRVLAAIGTAAEVTIHAHGLIDVALPEASFLALSPDPDGRFALTTGDVRKAHFTTSPLIVLAACRSASAAPVWHETWSLPAAFVLAGARAVIASAAPIPDGDAPAFFDAVRDRVRTGASVAVALRDVRRQWLADRHADWARDVIVFE
jgi:hypothetical protein